MPPIRNIDETYEPRPWPCDECGQILGAVMRVIIPASKSTGPHRVRRLWVFAKDFGGDLPATPILRCPPRGMFKVHGVNSCDGVECSNCGARNEWMMSKESYMQLIGYYQGSPR